jgi:hypothetical protein
VVAVGVAQEFQRIFCGYDHGRSDGQLGPPRYGFEKADRRVSCYYFYVWDEQFGPGFIKLCSSFPWPAKVWVNGHEWAKQQARKQGIGVAELAGGFAACDDPDRLQQVCDRLGPGQIQAFFDRWMAHIPTPLGATDRAGGYCGSCRCARSRSPTPWSWMPPGGRGRSLRRWWPTTWASAGPTRSR